MNPQYDMYGPVPGLDYDRSRFPHAHAPPPGLAPPPTLTAAGNKYQYAAYRQDSPSEFAPATYGSGSPQPLSDHPFEFDSEFALGTIDPALPSADAAAQLAPNWYLDFTNIPGLLDVPLSSPGTAYPTVHNPTGMLNEQPQQPDIYVHGHSAGQIMTPNGGGQYILGYAPYNNMALGTQHLGAPPGFASHGTFDVQEFQNDVANLNSMNGPLNTGWVAHPRAVVPSVNRQQDRLVWPAPFSCPRERPVRHSPIYRPRPASPRTRAIAKYWPHRVPHDVQINGFDGTLEPSASRSSLFSAHHTPLANTSLEMTSTLPEPTNSQLPVIYSPFVDPVPAPVLSAPEPAVPAVTPVQFYGHLSKDHWKFFETSKVVLGQVTGKPGGKQVHSCQYIDPATRMRCYRSRCHGLDGKPLPHKGFTINGLEDYLRHLWLHRRIERMISNKVDPAVLTVWNDVVLDAQKALDDARGIIYPYCP